MAGDGVPPEVAAELLGLMGASAPGPQVRVGPSPPGAEVTSEQVNRALWNALTANASKAAGAQDARAAKEYAAATLDLAQAIIALDPNLVAPQGITPEAMALTYGHPHDESGHSGGEQEGPRQASKETERNG